MAFFPCFVIRIRDYHNLRSIFYTTELVTVVEKNTVFPTLSHAEDGFHGASYGKNLAAAETGLLGFRMPSKQMGSKRHRFVYYQKPEFFSSGRSIY